MSSVSAEPRGVGNTADAGWQIGVSATVDLPPAALWERLLGSDLPRWLGHVDGGLPPVGATGRTADGGWFEVRAVRPREKVRLRWSPSGDPAAATVLQVSVRPASGGRSRVGFHQERLPDAAARADRREHWRAVVADLVGRVGG